MPEILTLVNTSTLDPEEGFCPLLQEGNLWRSNLTTENMKSEAVFSKMMLVNTGGLIGQLALLFVVNYIGMKTIQLICILAGIACSLAIPLISADYVPIIISIFMGLYGICIFCVLNVVVQIFPTRIRATSISVLMLVSRIGILSLNFLMANLIYTYCECLFYGMALLGLVIGGLMLIIPNKPIEDNLQKPSKEN
nr:uncharacterized protein LOC106691161 [Halyomorpha halys]